MDCDPEKIKLETFFSSKGKLRSLIPQLLRINLSYGRLIDFSGDKALFIDVLNSVEILIGDIGEMYQLFQKEAEDQANRQSNQGNEHQNVIQGKKGKKGAQYPILAQDEADNKFQIGKKILNVALLICRRNIFLTRAL